MSARLDALQAALEAALGPKIAALVRDRGEIAAFTEVRHALEQGHRGVVPQPPG